MATKRSHAKKVVDAKFLNDLANEIYNPKKGTYVRLCTGTLQNGPDPVDGKRTMHCGLGELYFRMTGRQPETDGIDEEEVVQEAIDRSALDPDKRRDAIEKALQKSFKELGLDGSVAEQMLEVAMNSFNDAEEEALTDFRWALDSIPDVNDGTGRACNADNEEKCSEEDFQKRSREVAAKLREAAALLPE